MNEPAIFGVFDCLLVVLCLGAAYALLRLLPKPKVGLKPELLSDATTRFEPTGSADFIFAISVFMFPIIIFSLVSQLSHQLSPELYNDVVLASVLLAGLLYMLPLSAIAAWHPARCGARHALGLFPVRFLRCFTLMAAMLAAIWIPLIHISQFWSSLLRSLGKLVKPQPVLDAISNNDYLWLQVASIIAAVALIPFAEEYIFRRALFVAIRQKLGPTLATLLSALVFAVAHIYPDPETGQIIYYPVLPILCLGVVLAIVYERTRSLYYPIILHALFNSTQITILLLNN
jgi:uncharacterized protein